MVLGSGVVLTLSLVLASAGAAKLCDVVVDIRRTRTVVPGTGDARGIAFSRLLGGGELALAIAAVFAPGRVAGAALSAVFLVFTAVHAYATTRRSVGCDCLGVGRSERTSPQRALVLTLAAALAAAAAAVSNAPSIVSLTHRPAADLVPALVAALVAAALWRLAFTWTPTRDQPLDQPLGERLVRTSAEYLERRFSRRTVLQDAALIASALVVAPVRYLLYPGTAMAAIRRTPSNCAGGRCLDGYTEFCCEITGGLNTCPEGTFPGGWWMCTDYAGRRLCADQGVRYYVDCNALPHHPFPGGCRCGQNDCNHRRVACNVFRYGQCNTHIAGVTAVVCRMVLCENPSRVAKLNCSPSLAIDNAVCGQDAPCLEPRAIQLAGAGGA